MPKGFIRANVSFDEAAAHKQVKAESFLGPLRCYMCCCFASDTLRQSLSAEENSCVLVAALSPKSAFTPHLVYDSQDANRERLGVLHEFA